MFPAGPNQFRPVSGGVSGATVTAGSTGSRPCLPPSSPLLQLLRQRGADVGDEQAVVVPQQQQQHQQQQTAEQQHDQQGETMRCKGGGRGGDTAERERKESRRRRRRRKKRRGGAAVEPKQETFESRWFQIRSVLR